MPIGRPSRNTANGRLHASTAHDARVPHQYWRNPRSKASPRRSVQATANGIVAGSWIPARATSRRAGRSSSVGDRELEARRPEHQSEQRPRHSPCAHCAARCAASRAAPATRLPHGYTRRRWTSTSSAPPPRPDERAAIDAVLDPEIGPAAAAGTAASRDTAIEGHVAHGGHEAGRGATSCSRRSRRRPDAWAGSAAGALNHVSQAARRPAGGGLRRRLVLRAHCRPRRGRRSSPTLRRHRLPARGRGRGSARALEASLGPRGRRSSADGETTWLPQPVPRPVRARAGGPRHGRRRRSRAGSSWAGSRAPTPSWTAGLGRRGRAGGPAGSAELRTPTSLEPGPSLAPQAGDPALRLLARVGRVDPTSLDAYRDAGGYEALPRRIEMGPQAVIDEVTRVEARGPGRGRVPDGPQVGRGRGAARHAPLPRVQRGRVRARHVQGPR